MKPFEMEFTLTSAQGDAQGKAKLSALLYLCQEAAGGHCKQLGLDWEALQKKDLFWALIRTRMEIYRLPKAGESVKMLTWPMPTTRTAFPRAAEGYDDAGNCLFRATSLWVLMDTKKRTMLLPGKSGVALEGIELGRELPAPGSLPPILPEKTASYSVSKTDIDRNGHVNNTRYLDWLDGAQEEPLPPVKAFTACYLAEALFGQRVSLAWQKSPSQMAFEVLRGRENPAEKPERIFAAQLEF